MSPGFAYTTRGRLVFDTGKVLIGLRAGETTGAAPRMHSKAVGRSVSVDAEAIQTALLATGDRGHPVDRLLVRWVPVVIVLVLVAILMGGV